MIVKNLVDYSNCIIKVKLKAESEVLIGWVGNFFRINHDPSNHPDIYPCAIMNVVDNWENYSIENGKTLFEKRICIDDIEQIEILKTSIPIK